MFAWEIIELAYACLEDGDLDEAYNLFIHASRSNPTPADHQSIVRGLRVIDRMWDGNMVWPDGF